MAFYRATENHIYSIQDLLGRGATGDVYKGTNKTNGENHALKMFDSRYNNQIQREVDALRKLKHQNIIKFYQLEKDVESRKSVLVMELCDKGNLLDVIREPQNNFGLDEEEFLRFFRHLVSGMKHLRQHGFSHRDIKPGNILVCSDEDGRHIYKLSDFGTAKPLNEGDFFQSLVGTEEYLHPDIFKAAFIDNYKQREFDISADLWSLGATLYHAATGKVPFKPYLGRGDKHTMFQMISKKSAGVISGEQDKPGGEIEWKKELPRTCKFSKYLRDCITGMLVRLLECQQNRMWTFDGFFVAADELLEKQHFHVFSMVDANFSFIYLSPESSFRDVKAAVQEQSDTQLSSPFLLFDGCDLLEVVGENRTVKSYPLTSTENPIIVVSLEKSSITETTSPLDLWINYAEGLKPVFDFNVRISSTEDDYQLAKTMCILTAMLQDSVHSATLSHRQFEKNVLCCRQQISQRLDLCERDQMYVQERSDDVKFLTDHDNHNKSSQFITVTKDGDIEDDDISHINSRIKQCKYRVEGEKEKLKTLEKSFQPETWDHCGYRKIAQTVDQLGGKATSLMYQFSENRRKTTLSYHDQQFHRFNKINMQNLYEKVLKLANNMKDTTAKMMECFKNWHCAYVDLLDSADDIETTIEEIRSLLRDIVQNMKGVQDPPLPSIQKPSMKQRQLAYCVKKSVTNIGADISESRSIAQETRNQMESLSTLLQELPELEDYSDSM